MTALNEDARARLRNDLIGFVFQNFQLLPTLTALENVLIPLELRGQKPDRDMGRHLLEKVGLADRWHHFPVQLSGGEQQRVAIARAIVADPSIVLADEPTAALDSVNGHTIMTILSATAKQRDRAVLVVTHDARLFGFADRIIHIEDGLLTREEPCNPDPANAAARGGSTRLLSPDLRKIKPQQAACRNTGGHPFVGVSHE